MHIVANMAAMNQKSSLFTFLKQKIHLIVFENEVATRWNFGRYHTPYKKVVQW